MRGIVLCNKRRKRFGIGNMRLVQRKRASPLHYTLSCHQNIDGRIQVICGVSDYVGVDHLIYRSYSLGFKFGKHRYLIAIIERQLKRLAFGSRNHLLFEHGLRVFIVAVQKIQSFFNSQTVLFFVYLVRTRRRAAAYMIIQTLTFGFCRNRRMAQPDAEQQLNDFEYILTVDTPHEWTKISAAIFFYFTGYIKRRKPVAHIGFDIRIRLVVL